MVKGSKARKCCYCGAIVMWFVPTGKYGLFGEQIYETKILPNFAPKTGKYCCKDCKAKELIKERG